MNRRFFDIVSLALLVPSLAPTLNAQPAMLLVKPAHESNQPILTARFHDPTNIDLSWELSDASVKGHLVEYTSSLGEDFVILGIAPREVTTFQHSNLAPRTKYFYRVRPYLGEASSVVSITTGKKSAISEPPQMGEGEPVIAAADAAADTKKKSMRDRASAANAAPAEFAVTAVRPRCVALSWSDRANDEDGYLIEGADREEPFHVIAFLPPDAVGFTLPNLPPETHCRFRIRAFFYGASSNVVEKLTGDRPETRH